MTEAPERQPLPPAGWYRDPAHPGRERWWDGVRWSDQVRLAETTPSIAGAGRQAAPYSSTAPRPYTPQLHAGIRQVTRPVPTHVPAVAAAATGLASFGRRLVATIIDNLLVSFVVLVGTSLVVNDFWSRYIGGLRVLYRGVIVGGQSPNLDDLSHLFTLIAYPSVIATVAYGTITLGVWSRTLGQRLAGIAVCPVDKHADKVGWSRGLARSLAWTTLLSVGGEWLLIVNAVSISMILWHPKRQSLPDLLARTQVVRRG